MTETAKSIITDALDDIGVNIAEEPISSTDAQTAIRALNRIMSSLASNGISIGYTEVSDFASVITAPSGAIDPMIALLAMRLWPKYSQKEIPSSIMINARSAMKTLSQIAVSVIATEFPSTLPVGSGNECTDSVRFYEGDLDSVLTEIDGFIALEASDE